MFRSRAIRRVGVIVAAVSAAGFLLAGRWGGTAETAAAAASRPPALGAFLPVVSAGDFGDPYVLRVPAGPEANRYVLYATANWDQRIPTAVSDDLRTWRPGPDALPAVPRWAQPDPGLRNAWGPSVLYADRRYVLYYATKDQVGHQCISEATSPDALGPFVDRSAGPLICQTTLGGSIDPSPVRTGDGQYVLLWKSDGWPHGPHPPAIWAQPLRPDGLALTGQPRRLLTADQPWQNGVVEGPSMARLHGSWWLFYSANTWYTGRYAIGVAACRGPLGPCRDASPRPLLTSRPGLVGPGGLETFQDAHGTTWAVLHSWRLPTDPDPYSRQIHIAPLRAPGRTGG